MQIFNVVPKRSCKRKPLQAKQNVAGTLWPAPLWRAVSMILAIRWVSATGTPARRQIKILALPKWKAKPPLQQGWKIILSVWESLFHWQKKEGHNSTHRHTSTHVLRHTLQPTAPRDEKQQIIPLQKSLCSEVSPRSNRLCKVFKE